MAGTNLNSTGNNSVNTHNPVRWAQSFSPPSTRGHQLWEVRVTTPDRWDRDLTPGPVLLSTASSCLRNTEHPRAKGRGEFRKAGGGDSQFYLLSEENENEGKVLWFVTQRSLVAQQVELSGEPEHGLERGENGVEPQSISGDVCRWRESVYYCRVPSS